MFELQFSKVATFKNDLLSGLTVALALVPEAVAFAFVAGVDPLVGLYAAFMVGLITACIGGRPGMISGATGALAVVMVALVADHGVEYLFMTVVLMGLLQITAGVFKLGKFIRMVPYPVMLGFVNGLAIVIFLAQLGQFGDAGQPGWLAGTFMQDSIVDVAWLKGEELYMLISLVLVTMLIIHLLPRFTKALPSSLVAIAVVTGLVMGLDLNTKVVGDIASISGGLPTFHIPEVPFTLETLWIILPYAIILAAIGLIESLLTLRLIDEITETRGRGNKDCIGQGIANTMTGFFGGMGGCAMIGQSMINVNSGGRGRLSGISAAVFLLLFILVGSPVIEQIPLAALIGVMFIVVIGTFEWSSFRIVGKVPRSDALILVLVSGVTVATDLAVAVCVGVIVSALVFAWEHAKYIRIDSREDHKGSTVYAVTGPLFFGSVTSFLERFDPKQDNDDVIIDFARSRVADHSGLDAIDTLAERYENAGKTLHLVHLSQECRTLLTKAGSLVEVNVIEDPTYFVAEDSLA
jgi:SulP family sulfate permease